MKTEYIVTVSRGGADSDYEFTAKKSAFAKAKELLAASPFGDGDIYDEGDAVEVFAEGSSLACWTWSGDRGWLDSEARPVLQAGPMPPDETYTTLTGHEITHEPFDPTVGAQLDTLRAMSEAPTVRESAMLPLIYGHSSPFLDSATLPGRSVVTPAVLDSPAFRIALDLLQRKQLAEYCPSLPALIEAHSLPFSEAAKRLGVTVPAIRKAVLENRLSGWQHHGAWWVSPRSLAAYKLSARGPAAGERSSTEPLTLRYGTEGQYTMHIAALAEVTVTKRDGTAREGTVSPWRRVGVLTSAAEGKARFFVLAPGESDEELTCGGLYVRGKFVVAEKINSSEKARAAWKAFSPE